MVLQWPFWTLVDKMSIRYPVTNEWYLPTSGGKITQFDSEICQYTGSYVCTSSSTPSDHSIGAGVAGAFDLNGTASAMYGHVQQYVYTTKTSGASNVVFRYGHKTVTGNVGVNVYPDIGLAVEPAANTETVDYTIDFEWDAN